MAAVAEQQRTSYRLHGTMTALSSITHFGDQTGGTESIFRRETLIMEDGTAEEIPVISGNSWRGQLRDCGMRVMVEKIATHLSIEPTRLLSLTAFYLLFSGGTLTKDAGRGIDVGASRQLRELIPLLSVLGGAIGRMIEPGKLDVSKIVPVCRETRHLLPEALKEHPHTTSSIFDRTQIEHYTRRDDVKDTRIAECFLPSKDLAALQAPKIKVVVDKKTGISSEVALEDKAQQMRYGFESLAAGSIFSFSLNLRYITQLEYESFIVALREWSRNPILGGRSAIGHGTVQMSMENYTANPLLTPQETAIGLPFGDAYETHLKEHGQDILNKLNELLGA